MYDNYDYGGPGKSVNDVMQEYVSNTKTAILDWLGPDCASLPEPAARQDNSIIYKVETPRYRFPLAIKYCKRPGKDEPDHDGAERMWKALERCHDRMKQDRYFNVPEPVQLLHDHAVVITEWVDGKSAGDILTNKNANHANDLRNMQQCGIWLSLFHKAFEEPPGRLDADEKIGVLKSCELYRRGNRLFLKAVRVLENTVSGVVSQSFPVGCLHGDYKPENVLVAGSRVVGIDIHSEYKNVVYYDIAAFLNRLELTLYRPRLWLLRFQAGKYADAFLTGYSGYHDRPVVLEWLCLYSILSLWSTHAGKTLPVIKGIYLDIVYKSMVRRRMRQLNKAYHVTVKA